MIEINDPSGQLKWLSDLMGISTEEAITAIVDAAIEGGYPDED